MVPFSLLPLARPTQASDLRNLPTPSGGPLRTKCSSLRVLITGALSPQRITFWTLALGRVAAEKGFPALVCHPAPLREGQRRGPAPLRNRCPEPPFSASNLPRDNPWVFPEQLQVPGQVASLVRHTQAEAIHPGNDETYTPCASWDGPRAVKVLPNLTEAVVPSEEIWKWLNFRETQKGGLVLVDGDSTRIDWLRWWWKHVDAVLLIVGESKENLIQNYGFLKGFRHYQPCLFVVTETQRASVGQRSFRILAGASRQFLGIAIHYVGQLPPAESLSQLSSIELSSAITKAFCTKIERLLHRIFSRVCMSKNAYYRNTYLT
jgi:hypothetical protein